MNNPYPLNDTVSDSQSEETVLHAVEANREASTELVTGSAVEAHSGEMATPKQMASQERHRRWHFQPTIHIDIATHKLAVSLNTQTGFLEADQTLTFTHPELTEFLDAISDQTLGDLQNTIDTICHFSPVERFIVSSLRFSKTGEIDFELVAECAPDNSAKARLVPGLSFERIEFNLKREGISQTE